MGGLPLRETSNVYKPPVKIKQIDLSSRLKWVISRAWRVFSGRVERKIPWKISKHQRWLLEPLSRCAWIMAHRSGGRSPAVFQHGPLSANNITFFSEKICASFFHTVFLFVLTSRKQEIQRTYVRILHAWNRVSFWNHDEHQGTKDNKHQLVDGESEWAKGCDTDACDD